MNRKSRTNGAMMVINGAFVLALLLAYLATHIPPSSFRYLPLFGLAYPFLLIANVLFIVYWVMKKARLAWISLIAILIGWNHFTDFFHLTWSKPTTENTTQQLKLMTFNVHLLGYYDGKNALSTRNEIFEVLKREQADLLCFQEFYHTDRKGVFTTRDTMVQFLPTKYYHERFTHALNKKQYFGVAMFSKYPMVHKGFVPFSNDPNNFCIYADLKINSDTVRVYNAHLQSIRFKPEDYALVDGNKNQEQLEQGGKRIVRMLTKAFLKREQQVKRLMEDIKACPYKVILCGDFNDTPVSYTYESLTDLLRDSFLDAGNGIGNTYTGVFPSFRIDYILHDQTMKSIAYKTLPEKLSDHHPVTATIVW